MSRRQPANWMTMAWLDREIRARRVLAEPVPRMGSRAWLALDEEDPRRWLAVLAAARAWFVEGVMLRDQLKAQMAEERARVDEAIGEAFADFGAEVLALREGLSGRRDFAEVAKAREEFARPALTPQQIREQTRASWAAFEERHGLSQQVDNYGPQQGYQARKEAA